MNGASNRFSIVLTDGEIDLLVTGLNMRACYIETGTVTMRAHDAEDAGKPLNALSVEQMRVIVSMDDLATRLRSLK